MAKERPIPLRGLHPLWRSILSVWRSGQGKASCVQQAASLQEREEPGFKKIHPNVS